ncbi:MAG: 50S ribosomal protein L19 [Candidatus Aureabacteria bacterium]|nr:50S ribosomal protein L19 [Candidatus Auribacterota bacterium]
MNIIDELEKEYLKPKLPEFNVGDTVKVHLKITEGDKERLQVFSGQVIARKGRGINSSMTVRKISYGEGVERVFLLNSPKIAKIEIAKKEAARRAKLYYTRKGVARRAL